MELLQCEFNPFDLIEFTYTGASAIAGVVALSAAVVGYFNVKMSVLTRILAFAAGIIFIAPSLEADLLALVLSVPILLEQYLFKARQA